MAFRSPCRSAASAAVLACVVNAAPGQQTLTGRLIASGLSRPLAFVHAGDPTRAYVVQQRGLIYVFDLTTDTMLGTPFIDLSARVSQEGNERGLLGLAFHPDFSSNGLFYVNYSHIITGATVIAQFNVTADPNIGDPDSFVQLLTFAQPVSNHNGGWIGFGHRDAYLYIASGDGGGANDPQNRAQRIEDMLLGKLLRIDVNGDDFPDDPDRNYAIPPTNPFVGVTGDDEIWAYGLRNPWRCSFDRQTGDLWFGDVGQNAVEEIDFQAADSTGGENYGWRCMEGTRCTGNGGCICDDPALTMPIHDYPHDPHCSVTGGYVYRGTRIPHMRGTYFFADYCFRSIWSFRYDGMNKTEFTDRTAELDPGDTLINTIVSFGEDADGELYICDLGGELFRILPRCRVDLNGDANLDTLDVLHFLGLWAARDPASDFNGDRVIDTQDVLRFLNDWNAGCG